MHYKFKFTCHTATMQRKRRSQETLNNILTFLVPLDIHSSRRKRAVLVRLAASSSRSAAMSFGSSCSIETVGSLRALMHGATKSFAISAFNLARRNVSIFSKKSHCNFSCGNFFVVQVQTKKQMKINEGSDRSVIYRCAAFALPYVSVNLRVH